jgi:hypothetical protein
MWGATARRAGLNRFRGVQKSAREPGDHHEVAGYDPEQDGFDLQWARSARAHELSAHGRAVQRRLGTPAPLRRRPSPLKRLRFALYRWSHGR